MYRLYSATPSPFARKVRIQLLEKEIPFELVTEVPWNADAEVPSVNPLGKVPALVLESGEAIFDSRYINEWIEAKHPAPPLIPEGLDDRLAVKRYEVLGDGVCDALVLMFFEKSRAPEKFSQEWFDRQLRKVDAGLAELSRLVGEGEWAWGDRFTQADVSTGAALKYLSVRWPDFPWRARHPNLAALSDRLEARPSFAATAPTPQTIRDRVA